MTDLLVIIASVLIGYLISETAHSRNIIIASIGFVVAGAMMATAVIGIVLYAASQEWLA